jgi:hypothetical protein
MNAQLTPIPPGMLVKHYPAKVAYGARKPMSGAVSNKSRSGNTGGGGAQATGAIYRQADRRALLSRAARAGK